MKCKKMLSGVVSISLSLILMSCGSAPTAPSESTVANSTAVAVTEPAAPVENKIIRLSTTTSVNDSGLLPYLQPYFEKATGYTLEITSAGTGAAIEKGRTGDADALLVHAKASEEEFIKEGYSAERIPFMYNFFVIAGPEDDPAHVTSCNDAMTAFQSICKGQYPFISRGDESGTNKAELNIWKLAGYSPNPDTDSWYVSAGQGMGACLTLAAEEQAYILTDKATYLAHEQKDRLKIVLQESDDMKNTYSMLTISPDKWPDTNIEGANAFIEWMQSDEASKLIDAYGVEEYGQQLFYTVKD